MSKHGSESDDEWAFSDDGSVSFPSRSAPKTPTAAVVKKEEEEDQEMSDQEDGWSEDWADDIQTVDDDDSSFGFSEIAPSESQSVKQESVAGDIQSRAERLARRGMFDDDDDDEDIPDVGLYCGDWRFLVHEEILNRTSKVLDKLKKVDATLPDEKSRYNAEDLNATAFELLLHYIYTNEYSKRWLDDDFKIEDLWEEESVYGCANQHTPSIYFIKESLEFISPSPAPEPSNIFSMPQRPDLMNKRDDDDASSTNTVRMVTTSAPSSKRIAPAWLNVLVYHQSCMFKVMGLKAECIRRFIHHASSENLSSRLSFAEAFTSLFETEKDPLHRQLRESIIKLCTKCTIEVLTTQASKSAIQEIAWVLQKSTKYMRHENRQFARIHVPENVRENPKGKEWEDEIQQQYSLALAIGISAEAFNPPPLTSWSKIPFRPESHTGSNLSPILGGKDYWKSPEPKSILNRSPGKWRHEADAAIIKDADGDEEIAEFDAKVKKTVEWEDEPTYGFKPRRVRPWDQPQPTERSTPYNILFAPEDTPKDREIVTKSHSDHISWLADEAADDQTYRPKGHQNGPSSDAAALMEKFTIKRDPVMYNTAHAAASEATLVPIKQKMEFEETLEEGGHMLTGVGYKTEDEEAKEGKGKGKMEAKEE